MTPVRPELGALLNAASRGLSTLGDRVLQPLHVTSAQWKVLVVLARQGPCRVADLVEVLDHDQAAVSRLVGRMEQAGLVERHLDPDDARAGVWRLTRKGRATYTRCDERLTEVMGALLAALSPGEAEQLSELLTTFTAAVQRALDEP